MLPLNVKLPFEDIINLSVDVPDTDDITLKSLS